MGRIGLGEVLILLVILGVLATPAIVVVLLLARGKQTSALKVCPACRRQVSARALQCPGCGDPLS
ncbi:MAG: hypothetical protein HOV80_15640 [Polyangiaceae bacterium]|nr:hypothetical protein [Polyangiaceae bacterium]